jgi:hypothetical protein
MSTMHIKTVMPAGAAQLCTRCSWGQSMAGHRESDRLVICNATTPYMVVPFAILECTRFHDRHRPSVIQMQTLAVKVGSARMSARTAGFSDAAKSGQAPAPRTNDPRNDNDDGAVAIPCVPESEY